MAFVSAGRTWFPNFKHPGPGFTLGTTGLIDATGEMVAHIGRVSFPAGTGSKTISRVHNRFGAVTKAGGSGLTISLQDVSATVGPPVQPDGTQDQTVAVANGNASFVSNTWHRSGVLSATRTVAYGEFLAVVFEYDGAGRLGADSVVISHGGAGNAVYLEMNGATVLNTGTWAITNGLCNVILEFDDGTFGTLDNSAFPASAYNTVAVNNGTSAEYALRFQVPFDCEVDAIGVSISSAASAAFDLRLMEGTTVLETMSMDANQIYGIAAPRDFTFPFAKRALTKNTTYYVSLKPTTTQNTTIYTFDVNDANHLTVHSGGIECHYATRTSGAWTATTTKRMMAGVRIFSNHDSAGAAGGSFVIGG